MPTARCASCNGGPYLGSPARTGTRYFTSAQLTPKELSHWHTSVPSRSIARILYPPPGNTTTVAPLLEPAGARYIVSVGLLTRPSRITGFPATRPSVGLVVSFSESRPPLSPGGDPGQRTSGAGERPAATTAATTSVRR